MFHDRFDQRIAWTRATLRQEDWLHPLPAAVRGELDAVAESLRRDPLPVLLLAPDDFALPRTRAFVEELRHHLRETARFVVIDRLPLDDWGDQAARGVYWLISSLLAPPVAQKIDGTVLYDVRDTGRPLIPGTGVRGADTNYEQAFHNDNTFNEAPPDYVGLLCLQTAKEGGISRTVSIYTIHNAMLEAAPQHLPRLYEDFLIDRESEHLPGEPITLAAPVFSQHDGRLLTRMTPRQIENGYRREGRDLDAAGAAAIAALRETMKQPPLSAEFAMERGQIQYVNNLESAHCRTGFVDHPEPERRRHLLRLWLRGWGRRTYTGR